MKLIDFFWRIPSKGVPFAPSVPPLPIPALRPLSEAQQWFSYTGFNLFAAMGGNARLWNCCDKNRIMSPLHLSAFTPSDLRRLDGFGPKTIAQAQILLDSFGIQLGMNVKDRARIEMALWPDLPKSDHIYRRTLPSPEFPPRQHSDGRWELCNKDFDALHKAWLIPATGATSCPI